MYSQSPNSTGVFDWTGTWTMLPAAGQASKNKEANALRFFNLSLRFYCFLNAFLHHIFSELTEFQDPAQGHLTPVTMFASALNSDATKPSCCWRSRQSHPDRTIWASCLDNKLVQSEQSSIVAVCGLHHPHHCLHLQWRFFILLRKKTDP